MKNIEQKALMNPIEQKALALVNEVHAARNWPDEKDGWIERRDPLHEALCRAVEQHEAFKQEVSDVVAQYKADQPYIWHRSAFDYLGRFVIPKPKPKPKPKPDPLEEMLNEAAAKSSLDDDDFAAQFRAALEARGLEIREKDQ
jgi:hypothetical protein